MAARHALDSGGRPRHRHDVLAAVTVLAPLGCAAWLVLAPALTAFAGVPAVAALLSAAWAVVLTSHRGDHRGQ
jgi:hypothetical protein